MDKEIVIVTAFFDINRKDFETYPRLNEEYFIYFSFWAAIQNKLIVYTEKQHAEKIIQIRRNYGLENRTEIIIIDDVYQIEPNIFAEMKRVSKDSNFRNYRFFDKSPENIATYDYIMMLKFWFIFDVSKRIHNINIAWIDFGFNHGGKFYINSEDFKFTWKYVFPKKITVFCLENPETISGLDGLLLQVVSIMGAPIIVPDSLAEILWSSIRKAAVSLISLDCIDDDQQLLLMVFRLHSDLFNVIPSDWFEGLQLCSTHKFSTTKHSTISSGDSVGTGVYFEEQNKNSEKFSLRLMIARLYSYLKETIHQQKNSNENKSITKSREYSERIYEKAKRFYGE